MNRQDIVNRLTIEKPMLDKLGVASLRLFGSVARDEAGVSSDADFVVRFRETPRFDRFMDLKFHLEDILGMRVDLVTEDALRPPIREKIERDAIRVA